MRLYHELSNHAIVADNAVANVGSAGSVNGSRILSNNDARHGDGYRCGRGRRGNEMAAWDLGRIGDGSDDCGRTVVVDGSSGVGKTLGEGTAYFPFVWVVCFTFQIWRLVSSGGDKPSN